MAGPCSPKHGLVSFKVLKNLFVLMLCSFAKTIKFMAGPRSPTSVTDQLILRRSKIFSSWRYTGFQQRSNERLFVLPQTRSNSFHDVTTSFRRDSKMIFKTNQSYGWAVLPQAQPNSLHGFKESSCLVVMQPFKFIQVDGLAALPNIPCHGPAHFAALKNLFVLMLRRFSTTFKWTAGRAPPNTVQLTSRR